MVPGHRSDSVVLEVFPNLNDSVVLCDPSSREQVKIDMKIELQGHTPEKIIVLGRGETE